MCAIMQLRRIGVSYFLIGGLIQTLQDCSNSRVEERVLSQSIVIAQHYCSNSPVSVCTETALLLQ